MIPDEAVEGHGRRPLDNGEYACQCGWVPNWYGASLAEQVAAHLRNVSESPAEDKPLEWTSSLEPSYHLEADENGIRPYRKRKK